MRIGIEAQRLQRKKKHGMDIVALELLRAFQKMDHGHEIFVFVKPDEDKLSLSSGNGIQIVEVEGGPYPIWEQILLPRAAKKHKIDVLHCTANTAPLFVKVPLILTLHDIIFLERLDLKNGSWYQRIGNLYRRFLVPAVVRKCEAITTVSNYEKKKIITHFQLPSEKVSTVYNGVGNHFKVIEKEELAEFKEKYAIPSEFILFLANTDPKKNTEGMLRALNILSEKYAFKIPLVMLDLDKKYLKNVLALIGNEKLQDQLQLLGYVPNQDLPKLMNLASLFVYPSIRESFGIPPLEALACGIPVVASNTSSIPEVTGNAALPIDPTDPADMAEKIFELWHSAETKDSLREKGLERVKQFSWAETAKKFLDLYEKAR